MITPAERQTSDVRILQKVNRAHREAFQERWPGQVEHILRLLSERLHAGLDKRTGVDPAVPSTWSLNSAELADLAQAIYHIHLIRQSITNTNTTDV